MPRFRHEWKHEISPSDRMALRARLGAVCRVDGHAADGRYFIRSLYFDNLADKALREKLDGVDRREKFRIRYYNGDPSVIHLEKKRKVNGLGTKSTTPLAVAEAQAIVDGRLDWMPASGRPLVQELYSKARSQGLRPRAIVDYVREPFVYPAGNVRVTLDYDIHAGIGCSDFLNPGCPTIPLPGSPVILEVKWDAFLPGVIQDNTYMKDYLTYRLMGEFGVNAPLCSYVYITVNGQDWGLYLAVEGLEDGFLQRNYGQDRGALYKPDSEGFGGGGGIGSSDVKLQYIDDDPDSYVNIFDSAKTEITDGDQARLIQALKTLSKGGDVSDVLDIDQVLRYFIVHNFVVNGDGYTGSIVHNYYLYEKDGRLSMLPWDYNLAFGAFQGNSTSSAVNDPIDSPLSVTGSGDRPMADWIFSSEEYTRLYHEYFEEFLNTVDPAVIIDEAYALIAPYVEQAPTKFCATEEFDAGVEALRTFCALRTQSVSGQLAGTIPSTGTGQSADSSALVDASALTLSDMGAANSRGGFGGGQNGRGSFTGDENAQSAFGEDRGGRPDFGAGEDAQSDFTPGEDVEPPSLPDEDVEPPSLPNQGGQPVMSGRQPFGDGQRPEGVEAGNFDGFPGGGPGGQTPVDSAGQTATTLILLGVSSLVLLTGLFAAFRFKRR